MSRDTDTQYVEQRIADVKGELTNDGVGWFLYFDDSSALACPGDQCAVAPAPGETARLYGKGLGYVVRGIVIEGRVYKYLTEEQEDERPAAWSREEESKRAREAERERAARDQRRAALPEALRERLATFEARSPNWRRDYESYELFVCEEAALLAAHFGTDVAALLEFTKKPSAEQSEILPDLKLEEHSGNTWGAAVGLARRLMIDPKLVMQAHGALCPLVGCVEYGCPGADKGAS